MMNNYPNDFVPLEIHIGDQYETNWGNLRRSFYNANATPTVWFDGVTQVVGASSVQSAFQQYQSVYLSHKAAGTDVTMEMEVYKIAPNTCNVIVRTGVESGGTAKNVRLQIVQLLDYWPTSPSYSRNTVKQGTLWPIYLTINPGEVRQSVGSFTLDGDSLANPQNVKFVAFVQDRVGSPPATIFNGVWQTGPFDFRTGDMNCDALVNFSDINPFVLALTNPAGWQAQYPNCDLLNGDINGDGFVDFADINPFVRLLTNP